LNVFKVSGRIFQGNSPVLQPFERGFIMRKLQILLLAGTTIAGTWGAAWAADMAPPVYKAPPPMPVYQPPPAYTPLSVTFYVGGQAGEGIKGSKHEIVATCLDPVTNTYVLGDQNINRTNIKAGIHGGFEVPVWVMFFGVEGYYNWSLNNYNVMAGFVHESGRVDDGGIDAVIGANIGDTGLRAAALLGYGWFSSRSTSTVLGSSFDNQGSAAGFQWGAKLDYLIDQNWAVGFTFRQTDLSQTQLGQKINVKDNSFMLGFDYRLPVNF
jgi:opacity protein-like surface antigen